MKAHIFQSAAPIKEGEDLIALCGVLVKNCVWAYAWDANLAPEFVTGLTTLNTCNGCYRSFLSERYIYGVVSREMFDEEMRRRQLEPAESAA